MPARRITWLRVKAPQAWRPKVDAELIGITTHE